MSVTKPVTVDSVAFGKYDDMVAEVGALDYLNYLRGIGEKFDTRHYRYAVMPIGDAQFSTEFYSSLKDARGAAQEQARHYGVKTWHV